jgi:glyoxylase-like metal-dependent hydrolase (beta-lactamase superfamily II)
MQFTIHKVVTGTWRENCYVVHRGSEAVVIDPGADIEKIESVVAESQLELKAILLTHGHFDHIGAAAALRDRHAVKCLVHHEDHKLVRRANLYCLVFDSDDPIKIPTVDFLPVDGSQLSIAGLEIETIHTPGHTRGSVCFRIGDDLFSGDTFHRGRPGRVDLPGGDAGQLNESLMQLRQLTAEIRVHPGHGDSTTIGAELQGGALASTQELG